MPGDFGIVQKSMGKWTKYHGLQIEVDKMWQTSFRRVPVIIGAISSIFLANIFVNCYCIAGYVIKV